MPPYLSCQSNNKRHCLQKANHSGYMRENHYRGYSGHKVQVIGQITVDVEYGSQKYELSLFIVTRKQRPPLLGCNWLHSIKLDWAELHHVQKGSSADTVNKFPTVFQKNVGTIKEYKVNI